MLTGSGCGGGCSNMLNEFRIEVAEPGELVLVQVHHEELVRGGEVCCLGGKLHQTGSWSWADLLAHFFANFSLVEMWQQQIKTVRKHKKNNKSPFLGSKLFCSKYYRCLWV